MLRCVISVILLYVVCCVLQDPECHCSKTIVPPSAGDSSDASDNSKVSSVSLQCILVCDQATVKTKDVNNESSPSIHTNVPSGDRDSGTESKVCQFLW